MEYIKLHNIHYIDHVNEIPDPRDIIGHTNVNINCTLALLLF